MLHKHGCQAVGHGHGLLRAAPFEANIESIRALDLNLYCLFQFLGGLSGQQAGRKRIQVELAVDRLERRLTQNRFLNQAKLILCTGQDSLIGAPECQAGLSRIGGHQRLRAKALGQM